MATAISITNLVKRFGTTLALDDFDMTVQAGEVHGFLGLNGAGKSTTIRILLGLLRKDEGDVSLLGGDPWHDAVALHRRLAYVPDDVRLWPNLTGGEVIDLFGRLRGTLDKARRDELLERFNLDPTKKCGTYSRGNRQKVSLVSAFASDVELLIMDEPTAGLDPLIICSPPNAIFVGYAEQAFGETISFVRWMQYELPLAVAGGAIVYVYLTRVAFPTAMNSAGRSIDLPGAAPPSLLSGPQLRVLSVFGLVAGPWIGHGLLDSPLGLGAISGVSDTNIAIAGALLLS